ncbi:MAG: hypothetical protein LBD32_01190, partial [Cytophagales bacterium]|nr:hypothetical protein [Cytophagales bacterium]
VGVGTGLMIGSQKIVEDGVRDLSGRTEGWKDCLVKLFDAKLLTGVRGPFGLADSDKQITMKSADGSTDIVLTISGHWRGYCLWWVLRNHVVV